MALEMKMLISFLVVIFTTIRAYVVLRNHDRVTNAILAYHLSFYGFDTVDYDDMEPIDYDDREPMWKTYLRFWDWGCKRIVPRHVYEKIKRFL